MKTAEQLLKELFSTRHPNSTESDIEYIENTYTERIKLLESWKEDICKKQLQDLFAGQLKCKCSKEERTGWISFALCNICGKESERYTEGEKKVE